MSLYGVVSVLVITLAMLRHIIRTLERDGGPKFGIGALLLLPDTEEYMLVKNSRFIRPEGANKKMWVYDGALVGVENGSSIYCRTGISCVPQYELKSIRGLW